MSTITPDLITDGTYTIDGARSNVSFAVKHMGIATVRGSFKSFEGTVEAGSELTLQGSVEVASVDTGDENRDGHLQSPEFFDAARYPQITFRSTGAHAGSDGKLTLNGEITIKGITKAIELSGEIQENGDDPQGRQLVGFEVEATIDRREFDLKWNRTLPNGNLLVAHDIKLVVSGSAVKAA